jgi:hypothetical protein
MGSYCPFGIWNTSYGQKKGRKSNWQFDSRPLKVGSRPDFRAWRWCATYQWKDLNKGYNFVSNLISIRVLHAKLWHPKVVRVSILTISGLSLGNPGTKSHLDVGPVERCRVYYKGEGGGFPQVRAVVSLVCPSCLWFVLTPKVLQLCTNHFVLVLCRPMWVGKACQIFLVPSRSSSTPLYPFKVLRARERALERVILTLRYFPFGIHIWVPQGVGSASWKTCITHCTNSELKHFQQDEKSTNPFYV